jgi:hypothetical protein
MESFEKMKPTTAHVIHLPVNFFAEEILNLTTDQTNIYGKQKQRRNSQNKTDRWKDAAIKDIE